jgi:pimeloyl-ACP methyl ester carboxylesterase
MTPMPLFATTRPLPAGAAARGRWASLAGRSHGDDHAPGRPIVFLHGLTFDRRMWDPVLDALPPGRRAIAFDLPAHGGSAPLPRKGLEPVVEAVHNAVVAAGLDRPIVVGHSIGGPIAAIYATKHPAAAVVGIEAPLRLEPFADLLRPLAPELRGEGFGAAWSRLQAGWRIDLLPPPARALLDAGNRPSQSVVLTYQSDLLDRPLDEIVRWRDAGLARLRDAAMPYVVLAANPVPAAERAWLAERLPQAEVIVWPVAHHFPQLADPGRFAELVTMLAAALPRSRG